ncbi:hypothetical protein [Faecalibacter sp. LW9]|uniref:hypothetical protein n=1 Tax=Faecalibacter sp. LW9 TaxID=3103144 RepID=UPI002AFF43A9|nr:hypothetical protein [Faecalibacter sp. LW9]
MDILIKLIVCYGVYRLTFFLHHQKKWGAVKASSTLALIIGVIYQILIENDGTIDQKKHYFLIAMGATFMGMLSNIHQHQRIDFIISTFIFIALYSNTSHYFDGLGGLLGTIACISLLCVFGIERILKKL